MTTLPMPIPPVSVPAGVVGVLDRDAARARTEAVPTSEAKTLGDLVPCEWMTGDLGLYGRLDKPTTGLVIMGQCALH